MSRSTGGQVMTSRGFASGQCRELPARSLISRSSSFVAERLIAPHRERSASSSMAYGSISSTSCVSGRFERLDSRDWAPGSPFPPPIRPSPPGSGAIRVIRPPCARTPSGRLPHGSADRGQPARTGARPGLVRGRDDGGGGGADRRWEASDFGLDGALTVSAARRRPRKGRCWLNWRPLSIVDAEPAPALRSVRTAAGVADHHGARRPQAPENAGLLRLDLPASALRPVRRNGRARCRSPGRAGPAPVPESSRGDRPCEPARACRTGRPASSQASSSPRPGCSRAAVMALASLDAAAQRHRSRSVERSSFLSLARRSGDDMFGRNGAVAVASGRAPG